MITKLLPCAHCGSDDVRLMRTTASCIAGTDVNNSSGMAGTFTLNCNNAVSNSNWNIGTH